MNSIQFIQISESVADQTIREESIISIYEDILKSNHRSILSSFDEFDIISAIEIIIVEFLIDRIYDIYMKISKLFFQTRESYIDEEILIYQSTGYSRSDHDDYRNLAPYDSPCKEYRNWIL